MKSLYSIVRFTVLALGCCAINALIWCIVTVLLVAASA